MKIIDSHSHLWMDSFDNDRDEVIDRTISAEVAVIDIGSGNYIDGNNKTLLLSQKYSHIYSIIGLHPHDADKVKDGDFKTIELLIEKNSKIVGIGEAGLDFFRDYSSRENQYKIFQYQIGLANNLNLPLIVHVRNAHDEVINILKNNYVRKGGIIHCFSGSVENIKEYNDFGFHISIPGSITFKNRKDKELILSNIPKNMLLVETDCPFISPEPLRGMRNEPEYIIHTIKKISEILGISFEETANITKANAERLFGIRV